MNILAGVALYLPDNRGGAEMMLHSMLSSLARRGHTVWVHVTDTEYSDVDIVIDGVRVIRGPRDDQFFATKKWDWVVSHLASAETSIPKAKVCGVRTALVVHSDHPWIRKNLTTLEPDLVVYNTHWVKESLAGVYDAPSLVVHPPVVQERFRTKPGDSITLVNLIPDKGVEMFYALAECFPEKKFLGVVGGYQQSEQVILDRPNVEIAAHTSNMRSVYGATRILLVPSAYESYGLVGVEAMVSGIPVIAHPTPGLKESLGSAGIFADRDDLMEWVRCIKRLDHPESYDHMSLRAKDRAKELDVDELTPWVDFLEK